MRKLVLVAAASAAALALSPVAFAMTAHPPTFSYTEHGRALVQQAGTMQLEAGKSLVVQTHVLEPGFRAPWHRHPDSSWVLMLGGGALRRLQLHRSPGLAGGHGLLQPARRDGRQRRDGAG
ncbi:MAG: hypothetical protein ACRD0O_08200 [Acidimicrobiia bacterium]